MLGACMSDSRSLSVATELLTADDFFTPDHRKVFRTCSDLAEKGRDVDAVSVGERHRDLKPTIIDLLGSFTTAGATEKNARIVLDASIKRRLIQGANDIIERANDAGAQDALEHAERTVLSIADRQVGDDAARLGELISVNLEAIEQGRERGVASGFFDIDNLIGGWQDSHLILVAARPGIGKTSLLADFALNASRQKPVLFFSLEMSKDELTQRFIASEAGIPANVIRDGALGEQEWLRLNKAAAKLNDLPLFIADKADVSMMDIRSKCRRIRAKHGLGMVVLDYIQLLHGDRKENRQVEVADFSRGLKLLAKEFGVPVIVAAQLNRALEARNDKRPMLADLRESGSLEQDADIVAFIYRPAMYDHGAPSGDAELIVAKHRGGPTGKVALTFLPQFTKFASAAIERHTREVR